MATSDIVIAISLDLLPIYCLSVGAGLNTKERESKVDNSRY